MPLLRGGRKPVRAEIKTRERIGRGEEGVVHEVDLRLRQGNRIREIIGKFVRKLFFDPRGFLPFAPASFSNPRRQLEIYNELKELNRKKKLGLRLIPTMRLVEDKQGKGNALILTKLREPYFPLGRVSSRTMEDIKAAASYHRITPKQLIEAMQDMERQMHILKSEGYSYGSDSFFFQIDPKTKKGVAILVDFGLVDRFRPKQTK